MYFILLDFIRYDGLRLRFSHLWKFSLNKIESHASHNNRLIEISNIPHVGYDWNWFDIII